MASSKDALVVAIELADGEGARALAEAVHVGIDLLGGERVADVAAGEDRPRDPALPRQARAEPRRREQPRVPATPSLRDQARRDPRPRVRRVQDHHPLHPLRVEEAEQDRRPAAPVVADDESALDPERVEQRDLVGGEGLAVIAVSGRLAPAEAAQVRSEQPALVPQGADHPPPHVPVLGPAVKQQDRRLSGIARARLGEVNSHAVRVHEPVLDALDLWQFVESFALQSICEPRALSHGVGHRLGSR